MILPAPLYIENNNNSSNNSSNNNTIELLDLSSCEKIFVELDRCFPKEVQPESRGFYGDDEDEEGSGSEDYLEVKQVGGYKVSVARSISDLRKIDPSVFAVKSNIDELLCKHYAKNFAFVICGFDPNSGVGAHPIGYISDILKEGEGDEEGDDMVDEGEEKNHPKLFVPTRHEHGHNDSSGKHDFDHKIYSINTHKKSGLSIQESEELLKSESKDYEQGEQKPLNVLCVKPLIDYLQPIAVLRRLEIKGEHNNQDFFFNILPSSEIEKSRNLLTEHVTAIKELEEKRAKAVKNNNNNKTSSPNNNNKNNKNKNNNEKCITM